MQIEPQSTQPQTSGRPAHKDSDKPRPLVGIGMTTVIGTTTTIAMTTTGAITTIAATTTTVASISTIGRTIIDVTTIVTTITLTDHTQEITKTTTCRKTYAKSDEVHRTPTIEGHAPHERNTHVTRSNKNVNWYQ